MVSEKNGVFVSTETANPESKTLNDDVTFFAGTDGLKCFSRIKRLEERTTPFEFCQMMELSIVSLLYVVLSLA